MDKRKSILFIVPNRSSNGTNSSLSSIYNVLKEQYNIYVLPINKFGDGNYEFLDKAIYSRLLDAYEGDFRKLDIFTKFIAIFIKVLKRIALLLNRNLDSLIYRNVANRIQRLYNFNYIVGFQEQLATRVASHFKNSNKIAWIHCDYNRATSKNEFKLYNSFSKIVCVSKYTKEVFNNRYPELDEKTIYIYNLLDIDRIKSLSSEEINDNRYENSAFKIISVGRMDSVKGFVNIPSIAKNLKNDKLTFKWYILGGPADSAYYKAVEDEISLNNVGDCVIMLGNTPNPYPYFRSCDLYVSTSISEACPMVFNEARIFNKPIVTTDFGSAAEFVNDGVDGCIRPINCIADAIKNLIISDENYNKFKENSYCKTIEHKNNVEKLTSLFK